MKKMQIKIIEPETDEIIVINNSEELHKLFEELKKESDVIHRKQIPS
ncbi:hypothetical protein IC006_0377 [Sulfuracidifex tepidarius]|uniref:Uncharacterized protein n=1 Tax=Sulfuracidifex tepidarius TaxID=1294262 RepID=A0A510E024_9CREN|nr:hypothetical protein IC006_0377 [Sulfuracidifex tepidarius]BBG25841.1 hypothetical protein IC007_0346 [Sulfuracidifex tepidarius]